MSIKPLTACIPASRHCRFCLPGSIPFTSRKAATSTALAPSLRTTRALRRTSALSWNKILSRHRRRPDMGFVAASKTAGANSKNLLACMQPLKAALDRRKTGLVCRSHSAGSAGHEVESHDRARRALGGLQCCVSSAAAHGAARPVHQGGETVRPSRPTSTFATVGRCCQGQEHGLSRSSVPASERMTVLSSVLLPLCPTG